MNKVFLPFCIIVMMLSTGTIVCEALAIDYFGQSAESAAPGPWKGSLADIERTSKQLLTVHSQLVAEERDLEEMVQSLNAQTLAQKERNNEHLRSLQVREQELKQPVDKARNAKAFEDLHKAIEHKRQEIADLQQRSAGLESKLNLRKLKLAELDLAKKAVLADNSARSGDIVLALRSEVQALGAEVENYEEQERIIRDKISDMPVDVDPHQADLALLVEEVSNLRNELAQLSSKEQTMSQQFAAVQDKKGGLAGQNKLAAQYSSLLDQKRSVNEYIAKTQEKLRAIDVTGAKDLKRSAGLKNEVEAQERENDALEEQVESLRENIAVLEYKVSSLERYQSRKKGR